jgi:hypothetical protein
LSILAPTINLEKSDNSRRLSQISEADALVGESTEAKEHLEISKGFPFGCHGEATVVLKAIRDDLEDGSMPPALSQILTQHASSKKLPLTFPQWLQ